jgi:riboflavin kinase / FMN adenylyltransferase
MRVFQGLQDYVQGHDAVATIGTFDGVHHGHQKILGRLIDAARAVGGESVVISFHPHPRLVLFPDDHSLRLLQSIDEKIAALDALGIDKLLLIPFTREFAEFTSQQFISQVLIEAVGIKRIVIGYDHHFGKGRAGGLKELQAGAAYHGYEVEEIPAEQIDKASVSSTKIRQALETGDLGTASRFLGYDYGLQGTVVQGEQLGRQLGYPTANIRPSDPHKLIPAQGVYLARVVLAGVAHFGMLNIGKKPTVGEGFPLGIEVHIFDFDRDIYGAQVQVDFLEWIRPDMKFGSLDELILALDRDRDAALALIVSRHG